LVRPRSVHSAEALCQKFPITSANSCTSGWRGDNPVQSRVEQIYLMIIARLFIDP
jgi:hypothetical protein